MKFIVNATKPRNPLVAAAHTRAAGSHRRSGSSLRQRSQQTLRQELTQLDRRKYSP